MSSGRCGSSVLSVSVLCASLAALGALSALSGVSALPPLGRLIGRPYTALEFQDLQCGGTFDRSLMARVAMVCRDCFSVYRDPELIGLCRQKCFTSEYFGGCLQALHITDPQEVQELHSAARILKG